MPRFDVAQIRRYYDRQTAGFVALGHGGDAGFIHRAVWGPGVTTRAEAFHFVEDRIAELARDRVVNSGGHAALHVLDLGCGVGGSLTYLASQLPMRGTGVTLSPVQARLAAERIQALRLYGRVSCIEGDYTRLPSALGKADVAFAIESFVHGPSPAEFFAECARLVHAGGLLIICDDFRRDINGREAERTVEQFRRGWHINTLVTRDELIAHAEAAGFRHEGSTDLTPWLELGRPRDRAIALLVAALGWLPLQRTRFAHVVGGTALQTALTRGWIGYELQQFRRAP